MEKPVICLDTDVLIDYFRKKNKENTLFFKLTEKYDSFAITTITEYEILCGAKEEQISIWDNLLEYVDILPFDSNASKLAAQLDRQLKIKNKQIAVPDLFIGAITIIHNAKLATFNLNHFERIDQLDILKQADL